MSNKDIEASDRLAIKRLSRYVENELESRDSIKMRKIQEKFAKHRGLTKECAREAQVELDKLELSTNSSGSSVSNTKQD